MVKVAPFGVAQYRRNGDAHRSATTHSCGPVEGSGTPESASKSSFSAETYYYHGLLGDDRGTCFQLRLALQSAGRFLPEMVVNGALETSCKA